MTSKSDKKWNQWLAGLIDGDGQFRLADKKHPLCEIIVHLDDEPMLRKLQNKLGGSITKRSGVNALRWRSTKKEVIIDLIQRVNGNIRNTVRVPQFHRICEVFNIEVLPNEKLTLDNSWISGFFDARGVGTINYYEMNNRLQLFIGISNKHKINLDDLVKLYGGKIHFDKGGKGTFKWIINNEESHMIFYNYHFNNPCYSVKSKRIFLIKKFYELYNRKAYLISDSFLYKAWLEFDKKWKSFD